MRELEHEVDRLLDEGLSGSEIARRLSVPHSRISRLAARMGRNLAPPRGSRFDWTAIRTYYEAGHTATQTRKEFGFSSGAWDRAVTRGDVIPRPRSARPPSQTRRAVKELLADGLTQSAIARKLGVCKGTVAYHARALGIPVDDRMSRRYDWAEVQRAYDAGLSATECCRRFGFAKSTWSQAVKRGDIAARARKIPIEKLLVLGGSYPRNHLKRRLLSERLKTNRCEECGISEWQRMPLSLQLHHKNGDGRDNRLENLELLCANCHSQTDTYGGRNGHRKPRHLTVVEPPGRVAGAPSETDEEVA